MAEANRRLTSTYTYVTMEVSQIAYKEIRQKLEDANYQHAITDDGLLNMHGLALVLAEAEEDPSQADGAS